MKLSSINKKDIPRERKWKTSVVIESFLESGNEAAELFWKGDYKDVKLARNSLSMSIRRYQYNVGVVLRGDRLFLVRKEETHE